MPYKSDAQRRLFHHLAAQGKIPMSKVREYDAASKGKKLPEFVGHTKKAFGGQIEGKKGVRCPACDYPLDQIPVALDAGEACPRCGYGDAKDVPHKARGGEIDAYVDELGPRYRKVSEGMERYKPREKINQFSAQRARSATDLPGLSQEAKDILAGKAHGGLIHVMPKSHSGHGGEVMDSTSYRARGGEMYCSKCGHEHKMARGGSVSHCARCGSMMAMGGYVPLKARGGEIDLEGNMKELYPRKKERGADLDDGKIRRFGKTFADAIKYRRR